MAMLSQVKLRKAIRCPCAALRLGILDFQKLKVSDFDSTEEALQVAKDYNKLQRETSPGIDERRPDVIMPNEKAPLY